MSTLCLETTSLVRNVQPERETEFVVKGSSRDGEVIRLKGRLITIGSAPTCDLRLVAKGIRPLEGFLVRGRVNTVCRAYEGQFTLNGTPTSEGILYPGDCLGVGPVRLVFMSKGQRQTDAGSEGALPVGPEGTEERVSQMPRFPLRDDVSQLEANAVPDLPTDKELPGDCAERACPVKPEADYLSANEVREIIESYLREAHLGGTANLAVVQAEVNDLRQAMEETKDAVRKLQTELQSWIEKAAGWDEIAGRIAPTLDETVQETRRQQSVIEELVCQVRAELERLDRMEAEVVRRQIDLATERSRLEQTASALAFREQALADSGSVTSWTSESSQMKSPVGLGDDRLYLPGGPEPICDTDSGSSSRSEPAWPEDPIGRETIAYVSEPREPTDTMPPEEGKVVDERLHCNNQAETPPKCDRAVLSLPESGRATTDSDPDHEVVIQDYLARLLGKPVPRPPEKKDTFPKNADAGPPDGGAPGSGEKAEAGGKLPKLAANMPRQRAITRRRVRAPEKNNNLAAMRELANLSSQAAIDRYAKAKLQRLQRGKLAVILVSSLCGLVLVLLDLWVSIGQLGRSAMVLSFIVMVIYSIQYGILTGRLVINSKGQLQLAERRIGREMRKLLPSNKPSLAEAGRDDEAQIEATPERVV